MNEEEHIRKKLGKWSVPGVPHKGWECLHIEDLEEPSVVCGMCESQDVRYVHHMRHSDYPEVLLVGCVCAGYMEEDPIGARKRDDLLKKRASKRKRWLSRVWKVSAKGNEYIKADGYVVTIFQKEGKWKANIKSASGDFEKWSEKYYSNSDQIKIASFDFLTKILSEKSR